MGYETNRGPDHVTTLRATFDAYRWEGESEDPIERAGWVAPWNPWGSFEQDVSDDSAEPESLELSLWDAAEFALAFPGGVWDWSESESEQDIKTGEWKRVTLHIGAHSATVFALMEWMDAARARAAAIQRRERSRLERKRERYGYAWEYWRESDYRHDPWGSALMLEFGVASALWVYDPSEVPSAWGFNPGAMAQDPSSLEDYPDAELYRWLIGGKPFDSNAQRLRRVEQLRALGDLLSRYCAVLRAAGRDY